MCLAHYHLFKTILPDYLWLSSSTLLDLNMCPFFFWTTILSLIRVWDRELEWRNGYRLIVGTIRCSPDASFMLLWLQLEHAWTLQGQLHSINDNFPFYLPTAPKALLATQRCESKTSKMISKRSQSLKKSRAVLTTPFNINNIHHLSSHTNIPNRVSILRKCLLLFWIFKISFICSFLIFINFN